MIRTLQLTPLALSSALSIGAQCLIISLIQFHSLSTGAWCLIIPLIQFIQIYIYVNSTIQRCSN
jgi:hypothetical protein